MMNKLINEHPNPYSAVIAGCGSFIPGKILTNDDLAKMVDTSDEWITSRTGIKVRHITTDSETTAFLAIEASKRALADANLDPGDLELIIVATITPEMVFPSTASFVQRALHAKKAWVFDVCAACSGFIYSLSIVQQFLESGRYNNALVIGAETLTKITDWTDRTSCILFGDGAGATVLQKSEDKNRGIIYSTMFSDGECWEAIQVCDLTLDDIKMLISHQMNGRIIESAAKRLKLPEEKVFINIAEYGNTSAASVPIAFDDCVKQGKVKRGDIIILVAFGAGLTWGANVIRL
jgi:3-oxoacyl-[acyl-carrier-protein] synthase-3